MRKYTAADRVLTLKRECDGFGKSIASGQALDITCDGRQLLSVCPGDMWGEAFGRE